jgi:hypothetical protein
MAFTAIGSFDRVRQREMERQVLYLLHRAGKPGMLADLPLMQAICARTGESDAVAALEVVVRCALPGNDAKTAALRSLIFGVDFNGRETNCNVARRRGISRRHLQRLRAQAVSTIARYSLALLDDVQPATPAAGSRRESQWRFQRECLAYDEARRNGTALRMRAIAANMVRLAENQESRVTSLARLADATLRLGKLREALELRNELPPAARLAFDCARSLLDGRLSHAESYVHDALRAVPPHSEDRGALLVMLAKIRVERRLPWLILIETRRLAPERWERVALDAEYARHLSTLAPAQAADLALTAWRRASALEYHAVAARCAAVLSECARVRNGAADEHAWRATSIASLLATGDMVEARTLFPRRGVVEIDGSLCSVLYDRLCLVVPQMQAESPPQRDAICALLSRTIEVALSLRAHRDLETAISSAWESDSAFVHYLHRLTVPVSEMLALALVGMTGEQWETIFERVSGLMVSVASCLPTSSRAMPIALPHRSESQSSVADHLRIDEFAGLRVRFVPVRSAARGSLAWQLSDTPTGATGEVTASLDSR